MFRSYWLVIAAFGSLGVFSPPHDAWSQQQSDTQSAQISAPSPISTDIGKQSNSSDHTTKPCKQGEDDRESDLCAQWKAADAAKDSADAAWRFGAAGVVIGVLTLAAAGAAAWFAKRAADETKRGANAAIDSVEVARSTGQAQTRAYLSVVGGTFAASSDVLEIVIHVQNNGNSPAKNVSITGKISSAFIAEDRNPIVFSLEERHVGGITSAATKDISFVMNVENFGGTAFRIFHEKIHDGLWFDVEGEINWVDVFNESENELFALKCNLDISITRFDDEIIRSGRLDVDKYKN